MAFIGCNYRNLHTLGKGSYGIVSKCVKPSTGEVFAKKSITRMDASKFRRRQLAFKEARIMQDLSGEEGIINFKDFYEDSYGLHIVMEYCSRGDLGNEMERNGLFYPNQAGAIIAQLAQGLQNIHSKGYLHRDMKLENILVEGICPITDVPKVKISDLGLAIPVRQGRKQNGYAGTLNYSALECLDGKFDTSTDMWALGVISYLLISGEFPHDPTAMDVDEAYFNIMRRGRLFMEDEWEGVPLEAKNLINSLLMRKKEYRPSAADVLKNKWIKKCFNEFKYAGIRKMSKTNQLKSEFQRKLRKCFQQTVESAAFFERVEKEAEKKNLDEKMKKMECNINSVKYFFEKINNSKIESLKNSWKGLRGVHMMIAGEEGDGMKDMSEKKDWNQERLRNEMHGVYMMRVDEDGDEVVEMQNESQIGLMQNKKERVSIKDLTSVLRRFSVKEEGGRKSEVGGEEEEEEKIVMQFNCSIQKKIESEMNEKDKKNETEFKTETETEFEFELGDESENEYEYEYENEYENEYGNGLNNSFNYYCEQESERFSMDEDSYERKKLILFNKASIFQSRFITQECY